MVTIYFFTHNFSLRIKDNKKWFKKYNAIWINNIESILEKFLKEKYYY